MYTAPSPEVTARAEAAAAVIREQIGNKAFVMLGAKNYGFYVNKAGQPVFSFRIQVSKKINHINVVLTGDEYRLEFGKVKGLNYEIVEAVDGVLVGKLHETIEQHTGAVTSLTRRFN